MFDHEGRERWNLFISAVVNDRSAAGAMLREDLALLNLRGLWGETPLHFLATEGETDAVRHLIGLGADLNLPNSYGDTPLINCVRLHRMDLVKLLLEAGAEPNHVSNLGDTAILVAADNGHRELYELLVSYRADTECRDSDGRTAAQVIARREGRRSREPRAQEPLALAAAR